MEMALTSIPNQRVPGIDALRGLAASGIVILHSWSIFPLYSDVVRSKIAQFLSFGVPLFFVLSAFALSEAYGSGIDGTAKLRSYTWRRFFRIAPLFYVVLGAWSLEFYWLGSPLANIQTYFLNLTFTFGLVPAVQTSIVPAGWSLGVEALFYLIFPLVLLTRTSRRALVALVGGAFATNFIFNHYVADGMPQFFWWTHFLNNLPYFALGIVIHYIYRNCPVTSLGRLSTGSLLIGIALLALATFYLPFVDTNKPIIWQIPVIWGIGLALIALSQSAQPNKIMVNPATGYLGRVSYSLYLVHPLIIYATPFVQEIAVSNLPVLVKLIIAPLYAGLTSILAASFLYYFIEQPCQRLARRWERGLFVPLESNTTEIPQSP